MKAKKGFTLIEWIFILAICFLLFIFIKYTIENDKIVQLKRAEETKKEECRFNLELIGLKDHNYNSIYRKHPTNIKQIERFFSSGLPTCPFNGSDYSETYILEFFDPDEHTCGTYELKKSQ